MEFVHLHTASSYSIRYGATSPEDLVNVAAELGYSTLALTDRDGLFGAIKFVQAAASNGIKPVLGLDLELLETDLIDQANPRFGGAVRDTLRARVCVLSRGRLGFVALNRLASAVAELGAINREVVAEVIQITNAELFLLLGPDSDVGRAIIGRNQELALKLFRDWQATGANVTLEIVSHRARDVTSTPVSVTGLTRHGNSYSTPMAARILRFAIENKLPAVLTNAVRYATRKQAKVVDVLDATRRLVTLSGNSVDRSNAEGYLKSAAEMWELLSEIGQCAAADLQALKKIWELTNQIGNYCVIDPQLDMGIGQVFVPELDVIMNSKSQNQTYGWDRPLAVYRDAETIASEAKKASDILRSRTYAALENPWFRKDFAEVELHRRLEDELDVVAKLGFASFFLTVAEVVAITKNMGIRVAARGSGAGSLINHLLGISALHPLSHGLVMERFLSPLRSSLPDIDIDVESHRRLEVYEAVFNRFGADRVAAVSMMDTYRVRHAIRDVGKALALPAAEIGIMAKAFPRIRARDIRKALTELPELANSGLGKLHESGALNHFVELVEGLDKLPRNVAMHPCGVLLSDSALLDRTPVQSSGAEIPMSHFDKDDVETMGFLKLDILGIRMQSAMSHAVEQIAITENVEVDLDRIDLKDAETFKLIQSTRTLGCFQIESPGQRELVGKFGPSSFNDLIIDISLFRPGPVKSDMITPFLNARHGWKPANYLHERLKPILAETAGVVVFHEQVIRIVAEITGCSLAEADEVRRQLGNWDQHPQVRSWFYPAGIKNGFDLDVVDAVWAILRAFASFGFCKAHAGAFALPTYQSAWLKTKYPAAFFAGILTHDPGMYPKRLILQDARNFGIPIGSIDVNKSKETYLVEDFAGQSGIRIPLTELKGISAAEVESIVAAAPFNSMNDLWESANISKPTLQRLVLVGALDSIYGVNPAAPKAGVPTRRDLFVHAADLERLTIRSADRADLLFAQSAPIVPIPTGLPELDQDEILQAEIEFLGMDVSGHVLDNFKDLIASLNLTRATDLLSSRNQKEVFIAGVKVATQTPPIRSGKRVVFVTLEDSTGPMDVTFFEDVQNEFNSQIFNNWLLLVRGVVRRTGDRGVSIRGTGCWDLNQVKAVHDLALNAHISPDPAAAIAAVTEFIKQPVSRLEKISDSPKLWHTSPGTPG